MGLSGPSLWSVFQTEKEIGQAVKAARERLGLSQTALASELGVDQDTIKKVESGLRVKQWLWLAKVAKVLDAPPNELLGFPVASPRSLGMALQPILAAYGANPEDADNIARILLEAVEAAQSLKDDGPEELRYKMAGQLVAARSRAK